MTVNTPYEELQPGPVGNYVQVIDYDATNGRYYTPVDLEDPYIMISNGLEPSEANPQFHQQMVYAIASQTIAHFESALGRKIKWDRSQKLRIFPHGMETANAYFDRSLHALVFGYFRAVKRDFGRNLPGQMVYTCLSHDIVAHETAHAILHDQRYFFDESCSEDSLAFHEAFADVVALFQHFTVKEPLQEMIRLTGGEIFRSTIEPEIQPDGSVPLIQAHLTRDNPLVGLAVQFGEAMGMRQALRAAIGTPPNSIDLQKYHEPHLRGSVLVAAIFDAYFTIYVKRTNDLVRISQALRMGSGMQNSLHPDIVNRLADTASKTASDFLNICIRALDYCPAVDIRFGDYLRAMITADLDLFHEDKYEYRTTIIDAFRSRGIVPQGVSSYTEESLILERRSPEATLNCPMVSSVTYKIGKHGWQENDRSIFSKLHDWAKDNADTLGLTVDPNEPKLKIQVRSLHPMHRVSDDGKLIHDIVAGFYQYKMVRLDERDENSPKFPFRGGTTVIFDEDGNVRYIIAKRISDTVRLREQREHLKLLQNDIAFAPYSIDATRILTKAFRPDFGIIHRGF